MVYIIDFHIKRNGRVEELGSCKKRFSMDPNSSQAARDEARRHVISCLNNGLSPSFVESRDELIILGYSEDKCQDQAAA